MIRAARRLHATSWMVFLFLVPALVIAALLARPILVPSVPTEVARSTSADLGELEITIAKSVVSITSTASASSPDLLLYWSRLPIEPAPRSWILIGPATTGRFPLSESGGALVLYSLARAEVIDTLVIDEEEGLHP